MAGKLVIVPTPIGNLGDLSIRVQAALADADLVAAEDTRRSRQLLNHLELSKPMVSYHEHNRARSGQQLLERIRAGETVALVSDAGMPGISDPGADLVRDAIEGGLEVEVLPGPTAFVNALILSGLNTEEFHFVGFLDRQSGKRREKLTRLKDLEATLIFYEAPHRILKTLEDIHEVMGNRRIAAARELTKRYEEVLRGDVSEVIGQLNERAIKGEFVLVVEGRTGSQEPVNDGVTMEARLAQLLDDGADSKEAVKQVVREYGVPKREAYRAAVEWKEKKDLGE